MTVLAIPVKDLVNAKQRLIPLLAAEERRALATAMLEDVLAALLAEGGGTRSARLVGGWHIAARLADARSRANASSR